jgi:hypothetical protein
MEQMKPRKQKSGEPSLREKLSQKFLEALEADFQAYGSTVLERMREHIRNAMPNLPQK